MGFALGFDPDELTVYVSRFGDFRALLRCDYRDPNQPNEWPPGTRIDLRFYASDDARTAEAEWSAVIDGDTATWHVPVAQVVEDVIDARNLRARLIYNDDDLDGPLEWGIGLAENTAGV